MINKIPLIIALCIISSPACAEKYPADSLGFVDVTKTPYFAKGDGITDDTAAIQKAIEDTVGKEILYFPQGQYLISKSLRWADSEKLLSIKNDKYYNRVRYTYVLGDGIGRTVIKLKDNVDGFADPNNPKAVLKMSGKTRGGNNSSHDNYLSNMTIDVGKNNPGAIGLNFIASNNGALENIHIKSSDPNNNGKYGLSSLEKWPGPFLVKNLIIDGFDYGIYLNSSQYGVTFQTIQLRNQRVSGFYSQNYPVIRNLISRNSNSIPAFISANKKQNHAVLIDANIAYTGQGIANTVALNLKKSQIFARNIQVRGYKTSLLTTKEGLNNNIDEYSSQGVVKLFKNSSSSSLNLPIADVPECVICHDPKNWLIFDPSKQDDDTTAFQAALNSGKSVIHVAHKDRLKLTAKIEIPPSVRKISFWHISTIKPKQNDNKKPIFEIIGDSTAPPLIVERANRIRANWIHKSGRTFVLKNERGQYLAEPGAGDAFFEDFGGYMTLVKGQNVYGWSLNPEFCYQVDACIKNQGANLRIIGLKTEGHMTVLKTTNGGISEVLGGFIYTIGKSNLPVFASYDSSHSLTYQLIAHGYPKKVGYRYSVLEQRKGVTKTYPGRWQRVTLHTGY
ncbi:MAG: glycoside hydrolase family 55 protein [Cyanobacteria bacterium P01_G01_bin.49]